MESREGGQAHRDTGTSSQQAGNYCVTLDYALARRWPGTKADGEQKTSKPCANKSIRIRDVGPPTGAI